MRTRMRRPETVKLEISDGDWLLVKKHLTAGEHRTMLAGMLREDRNGVNPVKVGVTRIQAYLLDWSITDADGQQVVIRDQPAAVLAGALDAIDVETFKEILKAIEDHAAAVSVELEAEKNARATASLSSPLSPSAVS